LRSALRSQRPIQEAPARIGHVLLPAPGRGPGAGHAAASATPKPKGKAPGGIARGMPGAQGLAKGGVTKAQANGNCGDGPRQELAAMRWARIATLAELDAAARYCRSGFTFKKNSSLDIAVQRWGRLAVLLERVRYLRCSPLSRGSLKTSHCATPPWPTSNRQHRPQTPTLLRGHSPGQRRSGSLRIWRQRAAATSTPLRL